MQHDKPSREELITQIADVVGKAKPLPPIRVQVLNAAASALIRLACLSYSIYLAFLFITNYTLGNRDEKLDSFTKSEQAFLYLAVGFFAFFVFRRVYRDRMTPITFMLKRTAIRLTVIIFTFLFWIWVFKIFPALPYNAFASGLAAILIINSGYDFRLSERRIRKSEQGPSSE